MLNSADNWIKFCLRNTVIASRLTFDRQWLEFPHYDGKLSITPNEVGATISLLTTLTRHQCDKYKCQDCYALGTFGTVIQRLCHFAAK